MLRLSTSRLVFRPLDVFLVILVTMRLCHSSRSEVGGNNLGDTASPVILSPGLNFLDYDLCLTNYEVSEGSIIRTKDSLALGARFINESDLGSKSREECLRHCCRTPHCNVISFEEKNSGSCYLFDCGPLENFRCKFTEQAHYMSAVLKKRIEPPSNTQHETELSQLRIGDVGPLSTANVHVNQSRRLLSATAAPVATGALAAELAVDNPNSRHCSRRQFECRITKECIAIYNACDGIVQCADGSDESAELHCPSIDTSGKSAKGGGTSEILTQQQRSGVEMTSGVDTSLNPSKSLSSPSRVEDFRLAPPPSIPNSRIQQQGSGGGTSDKTGGGLFLGNNGNVNFETSSRMNIFNHKDHNIMDDTYGNQLQQQRQNPGQYWKSYDYGVGETPNGYGQPIPPVQNSGAYANGNNYASNGGPFSLPYPSGNFQNGYQQQQQLPQMNAMDKLGLNIPQLSQQQIQQSQQQSQYYYNTMNNKMFGGTNNQAPGFIPDNSRLPSGVPLPGSQITNAVPTIQPTTTSAATKTMKPTSASKPSNILDSLPSKAKSEKERDDALIQSLLSKATISNAKTDDALVEYAENIPGAGAVFAFIVGLAMSILMVIMIGCRLRRIKMSSKRRGKNRLDPDYLVDGMYL